MNPRHKKRIDPNTWVLLKQIFYGVLVIGTVALIVTAIWYGTRVDYLTIKDIEVVGSETVNTKNVEAVVEQTLDGNYIGLIPRRFVWFYPKTDITTEIKKIDRINNIKIDTVDNTKLRIVFDEYVPQALWCNSIDKHDCAFVDVDGFAFTRAPDLGGGFFLRFIRVGEEFTLRDLVLDVPDFNFLLELANLLAEINWSISHIEVDKAGDAFLRVVGGGELKVAISDNPALVVSNLQAILASDEFSHLKPGNFQYIDLRFGNKVFVNEELLIDDVKQTSTSTSDAEVE